MDVALTRRDQVTSDNPDLWDLCLDANGQEIRLDGLPAEVQAISNGIGCYLGEWFLDTTAGVPWLQSILAIKGVSPAKVNAILTTEILRRGSISRVRSISCVIDAQRQSTVTFAADSAIGDVEGLVFL